MQKISWDQIFKRRSRTETMDWFKCFFCREIITLQMCCYLWLVVCPSDEDTGKYEGNFGCPECEKLHCTTRLKCHLLHEGDFTSIFTTIGIYTQTTSSVTRNLPNCMQWNRWCESDACGHWWQDTKEHLRHRYARFTQPSAQINEEKEKATNFTWINW